MGGHSPTFNFREILQGCHGLDSIICYEGEHALLSLVNSLAENDDWRKCLNLAYRDDNGHIAVNHPLPLTPDLDQLTFPSRDYLSHILTKMKDTSVVTIAASRGCYMNCGFCSIRNFYGPPDGSIWRTRSAENIIAEIRELIGKFPDIMEIVTVDDIFMGPPKGRSDRIANLRQELENNDLRVMFSVSERVNTIDKETVKLMHDIGVRQVLLGLESSSEDILDKLNKGITLKDQSEALRLLDSYGIDATISFINFTPWSTL